MHSNTLILLALSASAALASPFNYQHHSRFHSRHSGTGTGNAGARPTGGPYDAANDTMPVFGDSTGTVSVISRTISALPVEDTSLPEVRTGVNAAVNATDSTTTCTTVSTATATSVELVTVTSATAVTTGAKVSLTAISSISAGEFYGAGSGDRYTRSHSAGSQSASVSAVVPTTFATVSPIPTSSAVGTGNAGSASTATVSSVSSGSTVVPAASGGKKGISYNLAANVKAFSGVSWSYNWAASPDGSPGVEFVPMLWGMQSLSAWSSAAASAIASGSKAVLSFNEPDLAAQSNIDPDTAAKNHISAMSPLVGKVRIGSPAITNGAGTNPLMGTDWLKAWFKSCGGKCPVDFVAFHWYADASNFQYFKDHVNEVVSVAAANGVSKVWLTEFAPAGSADAQASFMSQAVQFLESTPAVERYAAFMASDGTLMSGGSLNAVGKAYAG